MRVLAALVIASVLVAACSGARTDGSGAAAPGTDAWRTATLRDVATGEDFRITDLEGKVVLIEAMAVWCINCRTQQLEVRAALADVDSSGVVYLSLDVDPNERADDLAEYARREGFTWRFAVASPEVSRSLAATFGEQVLSPPATPLVVIGPDGQRIEKHFGIMRAGDLASLVKEHLP